MPIIYALSDSIGETTEMVARATASQFDSGKFDIVRIPYITSSVQIKETLREASKHTCIICHTLVSPELRESLLEEAKKYNLLTVDIMGPMIRAIQEVSDLTPKLKPGLIHMLDQDYFKRVEAVEFAVKYDDGKNPWGLLKADLILVGVSRTSKTPLSMYLAHKKIKVANLPLVPEVPPPDELFQVSPQKIVGLVIDSSKLNEIRAERLKIMRLPPDANYATLNRIGDELEYAMKIMERIGCPVIDVSHKAIEETANTIMEIVFKNNR